MDGRLVGRYILCPGEAHGPDVVVSSSVAQFRLVGKACIPNSCRMLRLLLSIFGSSPRHGSSEHAEGRDWRMKHASTRRGPTRGKARARPLQSIHEPARSRVKGEDLRSAHHMFLKVSRLHRPSFLRYLESASCTSEVQCALNARLARSGARRRSFAASRRRQHHVFIRKPTRVDRLCNLTARPVDWRMSQHTEHCSSLRSAPLASPQHYGHSLPSTAR